MMKRALTNTSQQGLVFVGELAALLGPDNKLPSFYPDTHSILLPNTSFTVTRTGPF